MQEMDVVILLQNINIWGCLACSVWSLVRQMKFSFNGKVPYLHYLSFLADMWAACYDTMLLDAISYIYDFFSVLLKNTLWVAFFFFSLKNNKMIYNERQTYVLNKKFC